MVPPDEPWVFISYSHQDSKDLALRLYHDLTTGGYRAWLDFENLDGGRSSSWQIEAAIDRCHIMLALVSHVSRRSHFCIGEHVRALDKGKHVLPLRVQAVVDWPYYLGDLVPIDFHDPVAYEDKYRQLVDLVNRLAREPLAPVPHPVRRILVTAPPKPTYFVHRAAEHEALLRLVRAEGPDDRVALAAIAGMPGVGKSVLVQALCHDETLKASFIDGVIWVEIGPNPVNLPEKLREVGRALGDDAAVPYETIHSAAARFRQVVGDKAVLIVVDDIWHRHQVEPFLLQGPRARTLFTTRNKEIAFGLGVSPFLLGVFHRSESLAVLRQGARTDHPALTRIAERLGDLPQAVRIAAAQLHAGITPEVLIRKFTIRDLDEVFDLSLRQLSDPERDRCHALGIFPPATPIPIRLVARLWRRLDPNPDVGNFYLIQRLTNYCLLELDPGKSVKLHSLFREYLRDKLRGRLPALHAHLLDSYAQSSQPWSRVADDGYLHSHLTYHLHDAERDVELRELLLDFEWLRIRLDESGVGGLLADCEFIPEKWIRDDTELRLLRSAVRLSQNALAADRRQLAGQLLGRLSRAFGSGIAALLERAGAGAGVWLRPLTPTLTSPDGPLRQTLHGHADGVAAIAVSPGDRWLISGSDDGTVRLWDFSSGAEQPTMTRHRAGVKAVAVSKDYVLSGSDDGSAKLWSIDAGNEVATFDGPGAGVKSVAFTPDGTQALAGYDDGSVWVWNVDTLTRRHAFTGQTGAIRALCVTDECAMSGAEDGTVRIWQLEGEAQPQTVQLHSAAVSGLSVVDPEHVLSASWDRTIKLLNIRTGEARHEFTGHTNCVTCIAVHPGDGRAVSGSGDDTLKVWNIANGTEIAPQLVAHTSWVRGVALAQSGRTVASASDDGTIRLWDLTHRPVLGTRVGHRSWITGLALFRHVRRAISSSDDGTLKVWDIDSGCELATLRSAQNTEGPASRITSVVVSPTGEAVSGSDDGTLRIWDLTAATYRTLTGHDGPVNALALATASDVIVSGSSDFTLIKWTLNGDQRQSLAGGHSARIRAVACTEDGQLALSASTDGALVKWHLEADRFTVLKSTGVPVKALAMLPRRRVAVTGANDGTLEIWDLDQDRLLHSWVGHMKRVDSLATSGDVIVSASSDNTLIVWKIAVDDPMDIQEIARFVFDGELYACAAAEDGSVIAAGDASGAVHFLELRQ